MEFEHTNHPICIHNQFEIEIESQEEQPIEIFINRLRNTKDIGIMLEMVQNLQQFIKNKTQIEVILKSDNLPYLIDLARKQISPKLTFYVMKILTSSRKMKEELVKNGGLQLFVNLLDSNVILAQYTAIKVLGDLAYWSIKDREIILYLGGLEKIISLFHCQPKLKLYAMKSIREICFLNPLPKIEKLKKVIDFFCQVILNEQDSQIQLTALNSLHQLIINDNKLVKWIVEKQTINRLIDLLNQSVSDIQLKIDFKVLKIIKFIVVVNNSWIDYLLEAGIVKKLSKLFQCRISKIDSYIYCFLDLITQINHQSMILVLYDESILDQLLNLDQIEKTNANQVVSIISNCIRNGDKNDIQFLMEKGLFRFYHRILQQFLCIKQKTRIQSQIIIILKQGMQPTNDLGNQFRENYYLIELKQLELDKLIHKISKEFRNKYLYKIFVKLL